MEMIFISRNSAVTNELIDLIASLDRCVNLQELVLRKFPKTLELDSAVLERLATKCNNLKKLTIFGMQDMPEESQLVLCEFIAYIS